MPVFLMFGKYNADALKGVSPERTKKAVEIIGQHGGKVISMYAVLGEHDLVFTLHFPSTEKAMAASVGAEHADGHFLHDIARGRSRAIRPNDFRGQEPVTGRPRKRNPRSGYDRIGKPAPQRDAHWPA